MHEIRRGKEKERKEKKGGKKSNTTRPFGGAFYRIKTARWICCPRTTAKWHRFFSVREISRKKKKGRGGGGGGKGEKIRAPQSDGLKTDKDGKRLHSFPVVL